MGVTGLSAFLSKVGKPTSLSQMKGKRVAVDGNVWLHRGTYSCALQLVSGEPASGHIQYCCRMANLFRSHGVYVVIVFDGKRLPAKNGEHERRRILRARAQKEMEAHDDHIRELEADLQGGGATPDAQASLADMRRMQEEAARRAVRVTDKMVSDVMASLRMIEGVDVMRAPYEADAQLAYLARHDDVHCVVTEDSDLVAYGCPRVLLKLDRNNGEGLLVKKEDLWSLSVKGFSLKGYDERMLLEMCVLCGVDYLSSPHGLGIRTANKLMTKLKNGMRVIKHIKVHEKAIKVPEGYMESYQQAIATFLHQRVWSTKEAAVVPLSPPPSAEEFKLSTSGDLDACIGPPIPPEEARVWVFGDVEPRAFEARKSPLACLGSAFAIGHADPVGSSHLARLSRSSMGSQYVPRRGRDEMNDLVETLLSKPPSQHPAASKLSRHGNLQKSATFEQFSEDEDDMFGDDNDGGAVFSSCATGEPKYGVPPPSLPTNVEALVSEENCSDASGRSNSAQGDYGGNADTSVRAPFDWAHSNACVYSDEETPCEPDSSDGVPHHAFATEDVAMADCHSAAGSRKSIVGPERQTPLAPKLNPFAAPIQEAEAAVLPDDSARVCRPPPNPILASGLDDIGRRATSSYKLPGQGLARKTPQRPRHSPVDSPSNGRRLDVVTSSGGMSLRSTVHTSSGGTRGDALLRTSVCNDGNSTQERNGIDRRKSFLKHGSYHGSARASTTPATRPRSQDLKRKARVLSVPNYQRSAADFFGK